MRPAALALALLLPAVATAGDLRFAPVPVPEDETAMRRVQATPRVTVDGTGHAIGYRILMRTGQRLGDHVFGRLVDDEGRAIDSGGPGNASVRADSTHLIQAGEALFALTHIEDTPGALYLTRLYQHNDGSLEAVSTRPLDLSHIGGIWTPCAGDLTPWNSHLGSEEFEPDARRLEAAETLKQVSYWTRRMGRYFGVGADDGLAALRAALNPYRYGWAVEAEVNEDGSARVAKRYAMGRTSLELARVMPDRRTVYLSDDDTNGGLFLFVADQAADLTAGTLYAARWHQLSDEAGGRARLEWISLGHARGTEIAAAVDRGIRFSEMFDTAEMALDGRCPDGFTGTNTRTGAECLRLRAGMEGLASRLETRRLAAMRGATTEFRKEEGMALDADARTLYVAMSEINRGMEDRRNAGKPDPRYDRGGGNHIRLPENPCGAVYALTLGPDATMDSDWVATRMTAVIAGRPALPPLSNLRPGNTCDLDGIANPDNLGFIGGHDTLLIAEDSARGHRNNALWAWNTRDRRLTRILTAPLGAEVTSPNPHPDIGGHGYITVVLQHPLAGTAQQDSEDAAAYVGVLGPLPKLEN